jgi:hypothetical protein
MDQLGLYLEAEGFIQDKSWVETTLKPKIKFIILHLARMSTEHFSHYPSFFELFGIDILIDADLNVWFLELVTNPALASDTESKAAL